MTKTAKHTELVTFLERKVTPEMEDKHYKTWAKQSRYMGNGIYHNAVTCEYSTDTRELFLMYVANKEKINYEKYSK